MVKIESLAAYWNSSSECLLGKPREDIFVSLLVFVQFLQRRKKSELWSFDFMFGQFFSGITEGQHCCSRSFDKVSLLWVQNHHFACDDASVHPAVLHQLCCYLVQFSVVEPINANAKLRMHTKPEKDNYDLPKILLRIVFEEIAVALNKNQVGDMPQTNLFSCRIWAWSIDHQTVLPFNFLFVILSSSKMWWKY